MKLYIANAKLQTESFTYRVPDSEAPRPGFVQTVSRPRVQDIPSGGQILISGELSMGQIDAIIDQHRPYGLIEVSQIDRTKVFSGLCYSVDKPIPANRIEELMNKNIGVLEIEGKEQRKLAAISINNQLEADMQESGLPGEIRKVEAEVVEVRDYRSNSDEMTPERIRVTRDEEPSTPKPPSRARRKAA